MNIDFLFKPNDINYYMRSTKYIVFILTEPEEKKNILLSWVSYFDLEEIVIYENHNVLRYGSRWPF